VCFFYKKNIRQFQTLHLVRAGHAVPRLYVRCEGAGRRAAKRNKQALRDRAEKVILQSLFHFVVA